MSKSHNTTHSCSLARPGCDARLASSVCTVRVVRRVGGESGETQHWELGEYKHGDPGVHVRRKLHNADEKVFSFGAEGSCVRSVKAPNLPARYML